MVVDIQIKEAILTRLRVNLYHLPVVSCLSLSGGVPSIHTKARFDLWLLISRSKKQY